MIDFVMGHQSYCQTSTYPSISSIHSRSSGLPNSLTRFIDLRSSASSNQECREIRYWA